MVQILLFVFAGVVLISSVFSAINSVKSRRQTDMRLRGLYSSRMNIAMGIMLIFIALIQMLIYEGSSIGVVVGAIFILLGLFNLFSGIRNHGHFKRILKG